ncbi:uncharacterized protein LOC117651293 [Thrips palmi]|uniref:Uncharacterized protein LOC117651293 n=1 Tax=Thrips palmi TaxID=161013 RepID=A0A6P9A018_THRPL|nr:uncharacterized protein LOC117651293 [Thrips palmi]
MARALFIVLALAATAYADEYAFNQVDEIVARLNVCLAPVPQSPSSFYTPAANCIMKARWSLDDGNTKESLSGSIAKCLARQRVNAGIVATAQKCLRESLAKDLKPALEESDYSAEQLDEISSRIRACLTSIPETEYHTPASDCRNNALIEAGEGYPKESLVDFIIPCLNGKSIAAPVVSAAQQCITAALAEPLSA